MSHHRVPAPLTRWWSSGEHTQCKTSCLPLCKAHNQTCLTTSPPGARDSIAERSTTKHPQHPLFRTIKTASWHQSLHHVTSDCRLPGHCPTPAQGSHHNISCPALPYVSDDWPVCRWSQSCTACTSPLAAIQHHTPPHYKHSIARYNATNSQTSWEARDLLLATAVVHCRTCPGLSQPVGQ
jgi:hypothetical protein